MMSELQKIVDFAQNLGGEFVDARFEKRRFQMPLWSDKNNPVSDK